MIKLEVGLETQMTFSPIEPLPFSELSAPRWSVVTAEDIAASGLSYDEARKLAAQMSGEVSGLCIITDEAANKIHCANGKNDLQIKVKEDSDNLEKAKFAETL
ncbi:MAG: hypothetical protein H7Z37_13410 [Pyrinomonadaceae bacterium]|nr:hypothetical protein [Pyrinomonadaceae bacterium]